jgi:hypothetical protein
MVTPVNRQVGVPLRTYWYLLLIAAAALLAWGCTRSAGGWHIEAPGPVPNQSAIALGANPPGGQLQGRGTGVTGPLRPDPRPAPGG